MLHIETTITKDVIASMNLFIESHGYEAFKNAVFIGEWSDYALEYIHPDEELRSTPGFELIQKAFFNAYI